MMKTALVLLALSTFAGCAASSSGEEVSEGNDALSFSQDSPTGICVRDRASDAVLAFEKRIPAYALEGKGPSSVATGPFYATLLDQSTELNRVMARDCNGDFEAYGHVKVTSNATISTCVTRIAASTALEFRNRLPENLKVPNATENPLETALVVTLTDPASPIAQAAAKYCAAGTPRN